MYVGRQTKDYILDIIAARAVRRINKVNSDKHYTNAKYSITKSMFKIVNAMFKIVNAMNLHLANSFELIAITLFYYRPALST